MNEEPNEHGGEKERRSIHPKNVAGATTPISTPATGAPMSPQPRSMASSAETARSSRIPASSALSAISEERAVPPGASSNAPRNTRVTSCQKAGPTVLWSSGISATDAPLAMSANTLMRLKPCLSMIGPPKKPEITTGRNRKTAASTGESCVEPASLRPSLLGTILTRCVWRDRRYPIRRALMLQGML
jgi:hypothetical protein